jgi:hypothetical protein
MKKLNVLDINDENANYKFRYRGTYLHGDLEEEIGYDIFAFDEDTDFGEGEHRVLIKESARHATFFLWKGDHSSSEWLGYLVYNDDSDFYHCERAYLTKSQII